MKTEDNQSQSGGIPYTTSIRPRCLRKAVNAAVLEPVQIPARDSVGLEEITVHADEALKKKASCEKKETRSGGWKIKQRQKYGFALLCLKTGQRKSLCCWGKSQRRPWSPTRGDGRAMQ